MGSASSAASEETQTEYKHTGLLVNIIFHLIVWFLVKGSRLLLSAHVSVVTAGGGLHTGLNLFVFLPKTSPRDLIGAESRQKPERIASHSRPSSAVKK